MCALKYELFLGEWQDTLNHIEDRSVDAVITDPPDTKRTKIGYRSSSGQPAAATKGGYNIPYAAIVPEEVEELCEWVDRVCRWWFVCFNDHTGSAWIRDAMVARDWYVFAPVVWVKRNPVPRFNADGPTCSAEHITVARRKVILPKERRGSRPGDYRTTVVSNLGPDLIVTGQKPVDLMRRIIRDYTIPGDLIVDPYAGSGTTLAAARVEGRSCLGSEIDPTRHGLASKRISLAFTPSLFPSTSPSDEPVANMEAE